MPKITETQIGSVFLKETAPRKWRASWTDPITKRHIRRLLPGATFKEAEAQAKEINAILAQGKGFGGRMRGSIGHTVADAMLEAIKHTSASPQTRKDYGRRGNAFTQYLEAHAKGVQAWADVTESILANYIEYCRRADIAADTIRMRLFVIRLTSDFMSRTFPNEYRDVAGRIRLRKQVGAPVEIKEADAVPSPEQMRALFGWLKENEPMVHVWALLQGACGLREQEAAYLREQDIDPKAATVTITENEAHRPKNSPSFRTVPVPPAVIEALTAWIDGLKVRHPGGFIFLPTRATEGRRAGKSPEARAGVLTFGYVSRIWHNALKTATGGNQKGEIKLPKSFMPRKLRAGFITAMRTAGADFAVLQRYIGHRPSTILAAHYDQVSMDRLRAISQLSAVMLEGEKAIAAAGEAGK